MTDDSLGAEAKMEIEMNDKPRSKKPAKTKTEAAEMPPSSNSNAQPQNPVADMPEVMSPSELPIERAELGLSAVPPAVKMTVKTISATYERKFNLGEYESANLGVTAWADIEPDQDAALCIDELQELCKSQVRKQSQAILRGRKNGGVEYAELQDSYSIMEHILEDALHELTTQEPHYEEYTKLVKRLNALKEHGG